MSPADKIAIRASLIRKLRGEKSSTSEQRLADQLAFEQQFTRYCSNAGRHVVTPEGLAFVKATSRERDDIRRTIGSLGTMARGAVRIDRGSEKGATDYDALVAHILETLIDATRESADQETRHAAE